MDSENKISLRLGRCLAFYVVVLTTTCYTTINCTTDNAPSSNNSAVEIAQIFNYEYFKNKFHKSYSPLVSLRRASLFLAHTIKIFQHNVLYSQNSFGYHLAQNEFTDLTGQELLELFGDGESELEPVEEFYIDPNAPANSVVSVRRFLGIEEGYSSCAIEDLDQQLSKQKDNNREGRIKPLLSFLDREEFPDPDTVLKQLGTRPEMAKKISSFVDLKSYTSKYSGQSERANIRSKIKYKPVVRSNNDKYELQMKPSRGGWLETDLTAMNNEMLHQFDIVSYEPSEEIVPVKKSFFGQFFDKVVEMKNSVVDFFNLDGPLIEMEDGELVEAVEQESNKEDSPANDKSASERKKIEYKIDWRKSDCISKPRHQKMCNSCYAFATLSMLEYYYCKQNHESTSFSPQYLVDCGNGADLKGCEGGKISNTGIFIKNYGLELESMYPYLGKKDFCPFDTSQQDLDSVGYIKPQITHWQRFHDLAAWYRWIRKGPVVVGINMPTDFFSYGGGIHDGFGCDVDMTHALLLVGFGQQNGKEFWLLKNSYSTDWGENGYFRLSASAPVKCFNSVVVARVKFNRGIRDKVKAAREKQHHMN